MSATGLTLCMIARNEEWWIGRCLDSVKAYADEMIVVDTGSTDRTREIASACGAKVYDFPWNDSFAEARNYSLNHASGDWILWLDADEEADALTAPHLREALEPTDAKLTLVELINYVGQSPPHPDRAYRLAHHRLLRNGVGFRFDNAIHEQLNVREVLDETSPLPRLPVKIHHYGYLDEVTGRKDKSARNIRLLLQAAEKPNCDPWIQYHLASEYFRNLDYRRAFAAVNRSILQFLEKGLTPPSMLYKLKYASILSLGSFDGAWPAIEKAIRMYPDYVDLHFYKGVALLNKNRPDEALAAFLYCLSLGEGNLGYLTLKGLGSFQSWYYIGQCQERRGFPDRAEEAYATALQLSPDHPEAREAYDRLRGGSAPA